MSYSIRKSNTLPTRVLLGAAIGLVLPVMLSAQGSSPTEAGCPIFPANHVFNTRIDSLPVDPMSNTYIAELGAGPAHPDWGSATPGGFPMNIAHGNSVPAATVYINWPFTSDTGPFPIPSDAVVGATSDAHLIVLDEDHCILYEAFDAVLNANGSWTVDAISKFNLVSDALKPANWSSSNAAGTAQLPLLVRYDEVAAGQVNHAISMTGITGNSYVWPASHFASSNSSAPPMGTRFRLKASYDISGFTPQAKVVAQALKLYGTILTDNGSSWHLQGVPDPRFSDADLHTLTQIPASAFEAVDESSLEVSSTSGQVVPSSSVETLIGPSAGSGVTQTFVVNYTNANQSQEHVFFNNVLSGAGACYLIYDQPSNNLYIANSQGTAVSESVKPGGSGTLTGSSCSVSAANASVTSSGSTVTLSFTVTFASGFTGAKNIYARTTSTSGVAGNWQIIGSWTP